MDYFLAQLANGICQGAIYALMAIGYSTIVGVVGLATFSYGEVMMMGAFAAYYAFLGIGSNIFVGLIAGFIGSAIIGFLIHKICYEHFFDKPRQISLICTIAFSILMKNLAQLVFGAETKAVPNVIKNFFIDIGPVRINAIQIVVLLTVIAFSLLLYFIFNKTKVGIRLRAVSQNREAAALVGINVKRTALLGNMLGCGFGGIAGLLLALYYLSLYPMMGATFGNKAFVSSVIGGLSSIPLAATGGIIIGLIENIGTAFLPNSYKDVFAFVFLFIVLMIRPTGLARKKGSRP